MGTALGKIFKTLRTKEGLTQRDVSSKMGYTTIQFVSNWERGLSAPPIKDLPKLAKLYNTSAEYIFEHVKDAKCGELRAKLNKQFNKAAYR